MNDPAAARLHRSLLWLTVAAVCWRCLLATRTPVPAEDGVNYLWMAQRFAHGDASGALSEPFAPLWPLLLAVPVGLGAEPVLAGKVLGCLCGGLSLWPIAFCAERLRAGAGLLAAALAATSSLFARTAVEVYTEPLFVLAAAGAVLCGVAGRLVWLGALAGLAFWVRPEGALLPLGFVLLAPRRAWRALVPLALLVLLLGAFRWSCGHGFDPVPKLAFHALRDDLGSERADLLGNLLALPGAYMEAFLCAGALAVLSLRAPWPRGAGALWLSFLAALAAIVTFVVRRRFFVGQCAIVLPLAGAGVAGLQRLGPRGRELLLALACGLDLWTAWHGTIPGDRIAEKLVGEHLAARIGPGETVSGDMTRVLWYAGQRPLPPRHFDAAWLIEQARRPGVSFVVLSTRSDRGTCAAVVDGLGAEFARYELAGALGALGAARGITVLTRVQ
jgi:hypothetical protein